MRFGEVWAVHLLTHEVEVLCGRTNFDEMHSCAGLWTDRAVSPELEGVLDRVEVLTEEKGRPPWDHLTVGGGRVLFYSREELHLLVVSDEAELLDVGVPLDAER